MPVTERTRQAKQFRHQTFQILRNGNIFHTHTLVLNPEDFSQTEIPRVDFTQTLGNPYVEEWGATLPQVFIRGVTGYGIRKDVNGKETDGFQAFLDLRNNIFRYFIAPDGRLKQHSRDIFELRWYNWEDGDFFRIHPTRFVLQRSKSRPLLYSYDFAFTCINTVAAPTAPRTRAVDTVMSQVTQNDLAIPRIHRALELAWTNIELLLQGRSPIGDSLSPREILTPLNYPGIESNLGRVRSLNTFTWQVIAALRRFDRAELTHVDITAAQLRPFLEQTRTLISEISRISPTPTHLITALRAAQENISYLLTFPTHLRG